MDKLKIYLTAGLIAVIILLAAKGALFKPKDTDPRDPLLLSGFETVDTWGTSPEKGFDIALSRDHVTQGKYSLKVKYPKWNQPSINTKKLKKIWGSYDQVAFDVFNPQDSEIDFRIRIDDADGRRVNVARTLIPGANTIRIASKDLKRKINPEVVSFVVLFINEPKKRYTLYFDNFRLIPGEIMPETPDIKPDFLSIFSSKDDDPEVVFDPIRRAVDVKDKPAPPKGEIKIAVAKVKQVEEGAYFVSSGVPFAPGQLKSTDHIVITDMNGKEIPIAVRPLVRWHSDGSIRSVLVQFRYPIEHLYEYVKLRWGVKRTAKDLEYVVPDWRFPDSVLILPPEWLCQSQVIGMQVPMRHRTYDEQAANNFQQVTSRPKAGNLRVDDYYSNAHTYYQLYVRSGELQYFLEARKELLNYRDNELVLEGGDRGRARVGREPRYVYMQAMLDDYLLTGDPRTLEIAGYMAEYLKENFSPLRAFYPKSSTRFWTERVVAFPFLGMITYYELTGNKEYLNISRDYMTYLYKTQIQWPDRGGYIHNLYAHDPEEGAKPDEYGGSPFMTGLLLEAVIKYHRVTGSKIAADSIFRAVDWIINEGIDTTGSALKYMTARKYDSVGGQPDLNMLVVHAIGYAWRLSGYEEDRYLITGEKLFARGVEDAFLRRRKQFNQNYRSSGHYLAYIQPGVELAAAKREEIGRKLITSKPVRQETAPKADPDPILREERFEKSTGGFASDGSTRIAIDDAVTFTNGKSLRVKASRDRSNLTAGIMIDSWSLDHYPNVRFVYKIPKNTPVGFGVRTVFGDWVCLGGSPGYICPGVEATAPVPLIDDGLWREVDISVRDSLHTVLSGVDRLSAWRFATKENASKGAAFWIDDFQIKK